jgi:hypothetical protein
MASHPRKQRCKLLRSWVPHLSCSIPSWSLRARRLLQTHTKQQVLNWSQKWTFQTISCHYTSTTEGTPKGQPLSHHLRDLTLSLLIVPPYIPLPPQSSNHSACRNLFTETRVITSARDKSVLSSLTQEKAEVGVYNRRQRVEIPECHHTHHPRNFFPWIQYCW